MTAKCARGAPIIGTTAADGSFQLDLSGGQLAPCLLEAVGGKPAMTLHGFAAEAGLTNITPLSELVVARALNGDPALAFGSFDAKKANPIKLALDTAKSYVSTNVTAVMGKFLATDILSGDFKIGDADDQLLDSLSTKPTAAGKSIADLRSLAQLGSSLAPVFAPAPTPAPLPLPLQTPTSTSTPMPTPAGYECAPLIPKAGDSLTYRNTATGGGASFTARYDHASSTYLGKSALALTVTTTVNGVTGSGVTYLGPATGAYAGADTTATDTVITHDPPNYQDLINNTVYTVGQITKISVKVRQSGKSISDAFAVIGGGTALTKDYSYTIERKPNETLVVPAGSYANACKLQIDVTIANIKLVGNDGRNPLFSTMFGTLSSVYSQPFKTTTWLTKALPNVPKVLLDTSSTLGALQSTRELTAVKLAPR